MSTRRRALIGGAALVSVGVLAVGAAAPAFTAPTDAPVTTVRKSVQILMDPSGVPQATRLYTQYQSTGNGAVSFTDATSGALRNLNGFGTPPVTDGKAQFSYSVNGLSNQRSLQDYPSGDLPITVKVTATLDGQSIAPNDILGKSGLLEMTYTIENKTAVPQVITWTDGTGATQTKTEDVPLPYVGSFSTTLPASYADILAPGASMGGTGQNSVQLSYNLLLYKPLGDTTAVIKYQARVTNAEIPQVDMTFLPAGPAENASTKALQDQIKGGQAAGVQITDAGTQLDSNLLKLAAGAGQLNSGLSQLQTGATQLADGLNNTAVPGTQKLAAGANDLATGLNDTAVPGSEKLAAGSKAVAGGATAASAGATKLAAGSSTVAGGASQVASGNADLYAGLVKLSAGIGDLYAASASLPASVNAQLATNADYQKALGTLQTIVNGIGSPSSPPVTPATPPADKTVMGGLLGLQYGLRTPYTYANNDCAKALAGVTPTKCGAMDAVQFVATALSAGATDLNQLKNIFTPLWAGTYGTTPCPVGPITPPASSPPATYCDAISTLYFALFAPSDYTVTPPVKGGAQTQVNAAAGALTATFSQVDTYLIPGIVDLRKAMYNKADNTCNQAQTNPSAADYCGISQALQAIKAGIPVLVNTITQGISDQFKAGIGQPTAGCDPNKTLACASAALTAGAKQLAGGSSQVSGGASQVAAGNQDLAKGLATLSDGADQVAAGNKDLSTGLVTAADGATQVADGASQVATGLAPAAAGATQIADGLNQAVPGGTQIESGANQLSEQGSKKLIASGNTTANSYGEQYALMEALNKRSATLAGVPNGPATGTNVVSSGAFGYTLDGVTKSDTTNGLRFLLAALLLAAAVGFGIMFARD